MSDPRLARWADVLVEYCIAAQPGDVVGVTGGVAAAPLFAALHRALLARGAHPVMLPTFPDPRANLLALGDDAQLAFIPPTERFLRQEADAIITVLAETNTKALSAADPARQTLLSRARQELMAASMDRATAGGFRWSLTLWPTDAYAQDADLATPDFADLVFRACKLHEPDPAAAWRRLAAEQAQLIDRLAGADQIRLVGPDGGSDTDLTFSIAGRSWVNSDGKRNFPSGEIFTGPVEGSAEGRVRFSFPANVGGREVADVRLRFERGVVVEASARQNGDFLERTLDTDEGARRLGEFAFGTNFDLTRFTKNTLLDEKIGGTVHLALGSGYPETGSVNRSAVHWDLVCDPRQGGRVEVDGVPFLVDGRYV